MNRFQRIRRLAGVLAAVTAGLRACGAWTSAGDMVPDPGGAGASPPAPAAHTVIRTVIVGGMPGWEITLIAVGAAAVAAVAAAVLMRMRTAQRAATQQEPVTAAA